MLVLPLLLTVAVTPALLDRGTGPAAAATTPASAAAQPAPPDGRFLYLRDCAVCHGERGEGTPDGQALTGVGPAEVDYAMSTGRMPVDKAGAERRRRDPKYSAAERAAIVNHMRPFIAAAPDIPHVDPKAGDVAEGGEIYLAQCAACHQWAGEGGALLGDIESPELARSTPLQIAEAIYAGPANMPAFVMSQHEVDSVAAYVLELRSPADRGGAGLWHFGPLPEGAIAWVIGLGLAMMVCRWIGTRE